MTRYVFQLADSNGTPWPHTISFVAERHSIGGGGFNIFKGNDLVANFKPSFIAAWWIVDDDESEQNNRRLGPQFSSSHSSAHSQIPG